MKGGARRGAANHNFGKPMLPQVAVALAGGGRNLRSDPARHQRAISLRRAGMTPEKMAPSVAGLKRANSDPSIQARVREKIARKSKSPEARKRVSAESKVRWVTDRDRIIAAQNAGKGDEWRRNNSIRVKAGWKEPNNNYLAAMARRRKLSDPDVVEIRRLIAADEKRSVIAKRFGVDPTTISHIKSGRDRPL
jgi:hypothetical protein